MEVDPSKPTGELRRVLIPAERAGERLDRVLVDLVGGVSRMRLQAAIRAGGVRHDGRALERPGLPVEAGWELVLDEAALEPEVRVREGGPAFELVHEDEHLVVIDKPAGMLSHPTPRTRGGSVSELAARRFGELPTLQGEDRPGIVHRLDAGTSGVMVLGKTEAAFTELMRQFKAREVEKTYLALVWGTPRFDSDWIEGAIERSERAPGRMQVAEEGSGRAASTFFEVRERLGDVTLVACKPRTGRTHQIRVHMHHIGHPIVADALYRVRGGTASGLAAHVTLPLRQALHAHALSFVHPASGQRVSFEVPLAPDLERFARDLRALRDAPE